MFSTSTAKRVAREAEKIVSLKEDMDTVSWTRVLEIGNQLQENVDEAERVSLARELVSIAQSNRSLYTRLGLDPEPSSSRVMASGIEVMEGGLAEAAIEKRGDRGGRRPPIIEETIEETVHREVMEEVGLKVKNLRYYKSQPWSFSGTLLFGFFCDVDGDDTLTVDHEELSMAQWVERDKIPDQGNNISLTKEMMMLFRDGKEPR